MQTSIKTITRREIYLEDDECFKFIPSRYVQTWRIRLIVVHGGHFTLYGGPLLTAPRGLLELGCAYGHVDEVPGMPHAVAQEVQRCMDAFSRRSSVETVVERA